MGYRGQVMYRVVTVQFADSIISSFQDTGQLET